MGVAGALLLAVKRSPFPRCAESAAAFQTAPRTTAAPARRRAERLDRPPWPSSFSLPTRFFACRMAEREANMPFLLACAPASWFPEPDGCRGSRLSGRFAGAVLTAERRCKMGSALRKVFRLRSESVEAPCAMRFRLQLWGDRLFLHAYGSCRRAAFCSALRLGPVGKGKERKKKKGKENAPGSSSAATPRGDPAARRVKAASKGTGREARRPSLSCGAEDERSKPAAWGKPGRIEPVGFRARRILQVGSRGIRKGRFRRNALLQSGSKAFKPRHLANLLIMLP